jgi:hypothetical protein
LHTANGEPLAREVCHGSLAAIAIACVDDNATASLAMLAGDLEADSIFLWFALAMFPIYVRLVVQMDMPPETSMR